MKKTKDKMIIIDGNALIHRSFHALPPTLTTKSGEMVNAVYGFTNVLLKAIKEFKPEYIVLTLDKKAPTFRHKVYKDYKAGRAKAPDELYKQIPRIIEIADSFNIPIFSLAGFEADDLIGTIARTVDGQVEKIIVTGDLDTLQLVNEHTKVYTMSRGLSDSVIYDEQAVKNRFSLKPNQMIDFKALRGDPSDNIPGVRGIGEKTATELLKDFETLDGVYNNIKSEKIKDRIRDLLTEHKKEAYESRSLVTIRCNVKIKFDLAAARFHNFDHSRVIKLFSELEFKSLLPRLSELANFKKNKTKEEIEIAVEDKFRRNEKKFKYSLIDNEKKFKNFLLKLKEQKQFSFDTETSSFDPLTANLLGISFAWKKGEAYYLSLKNSGLNTAPANSLFNYKKAAYNYPRDEYLKSLKPILEDPNIKKFGHNIKFDIRVMSAQGIEIRGVSFDTMIASYLLNPGTRQHNLDALTFTELGHEKISKDDLLGKGKDKISFSEVKDDKLALYSSEDADFTFRLVEKLKKKLKEQKLDKLFSEIEMPLVRVLAKIEDNGIKINARQLAKMSLDIRKKINSLIKKIHALSGRKFNINSTQQLREILFERLQIPAEAIAKNKTGLSTAADELNKLKNLHPIIPLIQEYRELTKLFNTYITALPKLINKRTNRLHTSFNQAITATGRLSSTEPNLQNIPIKTDLGRKIRQAFIAQPGFKLLSLDYSQIELRLAAHMSGDKKMIKAFRENKDIHSATAAEINRVALKDVTPTMRREAKAINFGILYGQGPHGLSQTADIPYWQAKEFIDQYFKIYTDIKTFIDKSISKARRQGYAETLFHRRRYLEEINSSVVQVKKAAERMAINTPLQGTAADMIKAAMIDIDRELPPVKMLLQVHDELLFEVKDQAVKTTAAKIKKLMEDVLKLKVSIVVDASSGDNWGEMNPIST